jgi:hypothetical protein
MSKDPKTKRRTGTETSSMERVEVQPDTLPESPAPPTPPEVADAGSITGIMPLPNEVEDRAKENDDTTSNSPAE